MFDSPKSNSTTVLATGRSAEIVITGPRSNPAQQHVVSWRKKPVDVYVVFDDSESFASRSELSARTKKAVKKIIEYLDGMDWQLFMSGLFGNTTNDPTRLLPGSTNVTIDMQIDSILKGIAM